MFIATRRELAPGDLRVTLPGKTGPAIIDIGSDALGFYLMLDTPADCDALIAAAVEAKRLLDPPAVADRARAGAAASGFEPVAAAEPAQSYGLCPSDHPSGGYGCTLKRGHGGPHQSVEPLTGKARATWDAPLPQAAGQ